MRMGRRMCRVVTLRVGFLRVGFRVGFLSRLGVAAAPVAGVLSVAFVLSFRDNVVAREG